MNSSNTKELYGIKILISWIIISATFIILLSNQNFISVIDLNIPLRYLILPIIKRISHCIIFFIVYLKSVS